jgi:PEP-CTERM motif
MNLRRAVLSLAALVSFAIAPAAQAVPTLQMQLSSGSATSGVLSDAAHTGMVSFSGSLGAFSINVSTGTGVGSLNPSANRGIDLNSVNVASSTGGSVTIMLTETGLSGTAGSTLFQSAIGGTVGSFISNLASTITFTTYSDASNAAFGLSNRLYTTTFSGRGLPFSVGSTSSGATSSLYSQTIVVTIDSAAGSTTSFDAYVTPVPLPGTVALLGLGLLGLGLRNKARKTA